MSAAPHLDPDRQVRLAEFRRNQAKAPFAAMEPAGIFLSADAPTIDLPDDVPSEALTGPDFDREIWEGCVSETAPRQLRQPVGPREADYAAHAVIGLLAACGVLGLLFILVAIAAPLLTVLPR